MASKAGKKTVPTIGGHFKRIFGTGRTAWTFSFLLLVFVPGILALLLAQNARKEVFFGERVHFLSHVSPTYEAARIIETLGYEIYDVENDGLPVPRVFMSRLPESMPNLETRQKKRLFTAIMLPLVLRANELILQDRAHALNLFERLDNGEQLEPLEKSWLVRLASEYRIPAEDVTHLNRTELLKRVDAIPPSLAIAQAVIESGWGTSRFAQAGNALYGQWVWGNRPGVGIVPEGREDGETHRIRRFDYLIQSVQGYARNLNTHNAYQTLRQRRAGARDSGEPAGGNQLAGTLTAYSQRGEDYTHDLRRIIRVNHFSSLDDARLEPSWWASAN